MSNKKGNKRLSFFIQEKYYLYFREALPFLMFLIVIYCSNVFKNIFIDKWKNISIKIYIFKNNSF